MTDAIRRYDGTIHTSPKMRVNAHGWVEHHDETGSIFALTPAHEVEDLLINLEGNYDWEAGDE